MKIINFITFATLTPALALGVPANPEPKSTRDINDLVRNDLLAAADNITSTQVAFKYNGTDVTEQLNRTFSAILACPDSVIEQGANATEAWMKTHGYLTTEMAPDGWWQDTKCALAIATFIGTNLVSATKLLKIKEYIEALGGVAEAAELLLKCSTWAERLSVGGTALVNLAAEILGVSIIKDNCT